jgi:hypothetical protein
VQRAKKYGLRMQCEICRWSVQISAKAKSAIQKCAQRPVTHFYRPGGSRIDGTVPQHSIAACIETSLKQCNTQFGLAIDQDGAFPNCDGEPMGQAMTIDGMFTASGDHAMSGGLVSAESLAGKAL